MLKKGWRSASVLALAVVAGALLSGCAAGPSHASPTKQLLDLPSIGASTSILHSFTGPFQGYQSNIVATFSISDQLSGAVTVNAHGCALVLEKSGSASASVTGADFSAISSAGATSIQGRNRSLNGVIGPSSVASFSDKPVHIRVVTIYCGIRGIVVDLGNVSGTLTVAGSAVVPDASRPDDQLLVVGPPAVLQKLD